MNRSYCLASLSLVTMLAATTYAAPPPLTGKSSRGSSVTVTNKPSQRVKTSVPKHLVGTPGTGALAGTIVRDQRNWNQVNNIVSDHRTSISPTQNKTPLLTRNPNWSFPGAKSMVTVNGSGATGQGKKYPAFNNLPGTITVNGAKSGSPGGSLTIVNVPGMTQSVGRRGGGAGSGQEFRRDHRDGSSQTGVTVLSQGGVTVKDVPGSHRGDVTGVGGSFIDKALDAILPDPYIHGSLEPNRDHRTSGKAAK